MPKRRSISGGGSSRLRGCSLMKMLSILGSILLVSSFFIFAIFQSSSSSSFQRYLAVLDNSPQEGAASSRHLTRNANINLNDNNGDDDHDVVVEAKVNVKSPRKQQPRGRKRPESIIKEPWVDQLEEEEERNRHEILKRLYFFIMITSYDSPFLVGPVLDYYLSLGISRNRTHVEFFIKDGTGPYQDEIVLSLRKRGLINVNYWEGAWSGEEKLLRGEKAEEKMGVKPGDWILHVDSDEFQEYPLPLAQFLEECEQLNITITQGFTWDRVREDGSLSEIVESTNLRKDFPWTCQLTKGVMRANFNKLGPFKHGVKVHSGGYHSYHPTKEENDGRKCFRAIRVHHFKWTESMVKDLLKMYQLLEETERLSQWLEEKNGKICVTCPEASCENLEVLKPIITPKDAILQRKHEIVYTVHLYKPNN